MTASNRIPPSTSIVALAEQRGLSSASALAREALRKQAVNDSLNVPNPSSATTGMPLDFDAEGSRIDLNVMEIAFYDENPRTNINPLYDEIKESIRESGIRSPLVVTRKPNTKQYFLAAGGNTRLLSIRELWQETQDPRFYKTTCTFTAWKSDSDVLAGHLIENEVRGNMSFWDKAQGRWSLKAKLEAQHGKPMGLRAFEKALKEIGLATNLAVLSNYGFAVENLKAIGNRLAKENVRQIQPHYNLYKKLAALHGFDEAVFQRDCFEPVQIQFVEQVGVQPASAQTSALPDEDSQFDTAQFLHMSEQAVFNFLKLGAHDGAAMLRKIQEFPDITLGELKQVLNANLASAKRPTEDDFTSSDTSDQTQSGNQDGQVGSDGGINHANQTLMNTANELPARLSKEPAAPPNIQTKLEKAKKELMVSVRELVNAAKLHHDFYEYAGAQFGFFVEFPNSPLDSHDNAIDRTSAWWLIASLSGQQDDVSCMLLPNTSVWRRSFLGEPLLDTGSGQSALDHETRVQHDLGSMGSYVPAQWLAASRRPVVQLAVRCLLLHQHALALLDEYESTVDRTTHTTTAHVASTQQGEV